MRSCTVYTVFRTATQPGEELPVRSCTVYTVCRTATKPGEEIPVRSCTVHVHSVQDSYKTRGGNPCEKLYSVHSVQDSYKTRGRKSL